MPSDNKRIIRTICREGICPLCSNTVSYTYKGKMEEYGCFRWKCHNCGAHGQEGTQILFDGFHRHVYDGEGNPCVIQLPLGYHEPDMEAIIASMDENQVQKVKTFALNLLGGAIA